MQPPEGQQRPPQPPYYPPPGQQYGPPQYPQQPWQQPPPPKKKRRRTWLWIVLGVLAIVVLGCVGVVALASQASKSVTTGTLATTIATSIPTSASTPAPSGQHFKVGQTVKVGDTWQVTVNSAKTSQGDEFTTPTAGNTFVIVDVSLKNLSSAEQNISSALNFSLQDSTGQKYNEIILSGKTPPDGKVEAGSLLRGQLSYQVPTSQKALTFNFEPDILGSGESVWDIMV